MLLRSQIFDLFTKLLLGHKQKFIQVLCPNNCLVNKSKI